jgi:hypothetical protein
LARPGLITPEAAAEMRQWDHGVAFRQAQDRLLRGRPGPHRGLRSERTRKTGPGRGPVWHAQALGMGIER